MDKTRTNTDGARKPGFKAVLTGLAAGICGWGILKISPRLELDFFGAGSAKLAGFFTGVRAFRVADGWMLPVSDRALVVTTACSATSYFLLIAMLLGWRIAQQGRRSGFAILFGLLLAIPLTQFINALRVVTVMQTQRWIAPLLPGDFCHYLHMLTGVAVFLPSLIAINLLLEFHGRPKPSAC